MIKSKTTDAIFKYCKMQIFIEETFRINEPVCTSVCIVKYVYKFHVDLIRTL